MKYFAAAEYAWLVKKRDFAAQQAERGPFGAPYAKAR